MNPIWIIVLLVFSVFVIQESFEEQSGQSDWKREQLIGKYHNNESKKDEIFLIHYKLPAGNVTISTLGSVSHFSGFVFDVETQQADNLEIKIPRNFPYTNSGSFGMLVLVNGEENNDYVLTMTDCFLHYSIPINGNFELELASITYPASIPFIGETVPDQCLVETLLLPPKQQILNGILIDDVICKQELELMIKISNKTPVCVTHSSAQKLIEREWGHLPN